MPPFVKVGTQGRFRALGNSDLTPNSAAAASPGGLAKRRRQTNRRKLEEKYECRKKKYAGDKQKVHRRQTKSMQETNKRRWEKIVQKLQESKPAYLRAALSDESKTKTGKYLQKVIGYPCH